jgi:hypothetical protein
MSTLKATISMLRERRRSLGSSLINLMRKIPIIRRKMKKLITWKKPLKVSGMTKSGWKRKRRSRLKRSRSGSPEPITSSKRGTFCRSRSLSPKGRISCSSWPSEGYRIRWQRAMPRCPRSREGMRKLTAKLS